MNSLLEKLRIKYPIIQAPMAGVSTPALAAAVTNAGGLGSIGVGSVDSKTARETIEATQKLTDGPINVNVFCHQPAVANIEKESEWLRYLTPVFQKFDAEPPTKLGEIYKSFVHDDESLRVLLDTRPKVVSFHFGLPSLEKIARLKDVGIVLLASATNLDEARKIAVAGIDAVIAQGYEAGGHRGCFDPLAADSCLGVFALTRLLVRELDIPVIAAGGIMDGAGIVSALALGAQAAQLGTAFVACAESAADEHYRTALLSDAAYQTVMTKSISGRPARCLANKFTAIGKIVDQSIVPDYPIAYDAGKSLNAAAKARGEGGFGAQWAGQGAPLSRSLPVAELMAQLKKEMKENS